TIVKNTQINGPMISYPSFSPNDDVNINIATTLEKLKANLDVFLAKSILFFIAIATEESNNIKNIKVIRILFRLYPIFWSTIINPSITGFERSPRNIFVIIKIIKEYLVIPSATKDL